MKNLITDDSKKVLRPVNYCSFKGVLFIAAKVLSCSPRAGMMTEGKMPHLLSGLSGKLSGSWEGKYGLRTAWGKTSSCTVCLSWICRPAYPLPLCIKCCFHWNSSGIFSEDAEKTASPSVLCNLLCGIRAEPACPVGMRLFCVILPAGVYPCVLEITILNAPARKFCVRIIGLKFSQCIAARASCWHGSPLELPLQRFWNTDAWN